MCSCEPTQRGMALARRSGGSPRVFFSDPHRGHKAHARGKPLLWLLGTLASSTTSPRADIFDFGDQPARWPRLRTCAFRAAVTARTRAPECSEPPLPLELPRSSRGCGACPWRTSARRTPPRWPRQRQRCALVARCTRPPWTCAHAPDGRAPRVGFGLPAIAEQPGVSRRVFP